jgi:hypothetical protein
MALVYARGPASHVELASKHPALAACGGWPRSSVRSVRSAPPGRPGERGAATAAPIAGMATAAGAAVATGLFSSCSDAGSAADPLSATPTLLVSGGVSAWV